ncbi:hypothetical protein Q8W38_13010 [Vibrio splendidus]|uniref:Uncharacterized protein n=1 Tax=Vibrio splendidus TaxID=29497 RepID=A0ABD5AD56_VIBSP|nr:hypothetical protein [Vibrio splendidus]MDP2490261.1 hypothetical protein [Vibrio splendidus]PMO56877.1 hypothetical protein BCT08_09040 [Vibrio splendidus]PTP98283.1 hypothetical protein CWO34_12485 [Vibrio splendidus]
MGKVLGVKFVNKLIELINSKDTELVLKELLRTSIIQDDKICEIIYKCLIHDRALDKATRKILINIINEIDVSHSDYDGWMLAFYIVMHTGNFDIAYALRENAKNSLYERYRLGYFNNSNLYQLLALALEDENGELYQEVKEKIVTSNEKDSLILKQLESIYYCCSGNNGDFKFNRTKNDDKFSEYIKSKKVAIIAPTTVNLVDANEIDSSDVVVRLNYSSSGQGCDPLNKGLKTNVSYYNNITMGKINSEHNGLVPEELDFVVTKRPVELNGRDTKCSESFDSALLNGAFNLLPNALFDLLMFSPSEIKIYHSDMQIKPSLRVAKYYAEKSVFNDDELHKKHVAKSFSVHDPFGQHSLMRQVVENNEHIFVDDMLKNVLSMTLQEYAFELTENYKPDESKSEMVKLDKLNSELSEKDKVISSKDLKIKSQDDKIKSLRKKIKLQENSLSWKLTLPLRKINKKLK